MPPALDDERESYLVWLAFLRTAVLRKLHGLDETNARWRPADQLISVLGVVNHLTHVEWRWIDGGFGGVPVRRDEAEFTPDRDRSVAEVVERYQQRRCADGGGRPLAVTGRALSARPEREPTLGPAPPHQRNSATCWTRRCNEGAPGRSNRGVEGESRPRETPLAIGGLLPRRRAAARSRIHS